MLTRDAIFAADDSKYEEVDVPEWGGMVRVRTMTGKERQAFQKAIPEDGKAPDDFMERLVIAAACDSSGKPIFTAEDIEALGNKSAVVLERVFRAAANLNGLTSEALEQIKGE